ncbi:MAG: hypothetical protein RIS06_1204 [Actinomycetota bacterium]
MATKIPPSTPALNLHRGNCLDLIPVTIPLNPFRTFLLVAKIKFKIINPDPNENSAASTPLPNRADNPPFTRD